jgi:hypothetical protein
MDPADLAMKSLRVEKDADAEAISWEVWGMDEVQGGGPSAIRPLPRRWTGGNTRIS